MTTPEPTDEFHRIINLLKERGFVRRVFEDAPRGGISAEWTEDGIMLQKLLRRLFEVRDISELHRMSDSTISSFIYVTLGTEPVGNRG